MIFVKHLPMPKTVRKQRSLYQNTRLYHHHFRRKGSYQFAAKNFFRLLLGLSVLGLSLGLINHYLIDVDILMKSLFESFPTEGILLVFFLSESILGILPPDLFIYWTRIWENPWLGITILALLSYGGGIASYFIGTRIGALPAVKLWLIRKFRTQLVTLKRYGGLLIFISALTPLPFSPISTISGLINYGFKRYAIMALSRIIRFYLYALVLFQI